MIVMISVGPYKRGFAQPYFGEPMGLAGPWSIGSQNPTSGRLPRRGIPDPLVPHVLRRDSNLA
jgi:hypothetical protein